MSLILGVTKEVESETRVSATPKTVGDFVKLGFSVEIQKGAGEGSSISDKDYTDVGAKIVDDVSGSDVILRINPPSVSELNGMKKGCSVITLFNPSLDEKALLKAVDKEISFFSLMLLPRISRAQSMDVLSSQSNLAGYKAVLMGAHELGKIFPLMMTAAGTIKPAKVVILGAGVAGLQAIATAKRLGAQVEVSDVRPEVKEQVESLGGNFIDVPLDKESEGVSNKDGYAHKITPEYLARQKKEVTERLKSADIVITTALVAGGQAPKLIDEGMIKGMPNGSVIVDMAAVQGGNCTLTKPGKTVKAGGVTIIGHTNIPGTLAVHASQLFAANVLSFLKLIVKEGKLVFDTTDDIIKATLLAHGGKQLWEAKK